MKKMYYVNAIPFLLWICAFGIDFIWQYGLCDYDYLWILPTYITLALLLIMPIVFVIINGFCVKKYKNYFVFNTILAFSCAIGWFVFGILYYNFISSDGETLLLAQVLPIVSFVYVFLLAAIGFIIKLVLNKLKRRKICEKY